MKEFNVNEYITLKLENGKTNIYLGGELFRQCNFLLLNIPIKKISSLDEIVSTDEAIKKLNEANIAEHEIPPDVEFWAHCSNFQVWAEYNYNTRLFHRNFAFPLLKKLTNVGDNVAKKVFKKEIIKRYKSKFPSVQIYLIKEGYLNYFSQEELEKLVGEKFYMEKFDENTKKKYLLQILIAEYLKNDQFNEAVNILKQGLNISPNSHNFWNTIGLCYTKNKQFEKAFEAYKKALRIDSSNYRVLNNLGIISNKVNKFDKAIHYFRKALDILGDHDPEKFKNAISENIKKLNETIENFNIKNNKKLPKYCIKCYSKIKPGIKVCTSCGYGIELDFKINKYITLKLENGYTNVYINGELFTQLKYLLVKKPNGKIDYINESESFDDAAERLRKSIEPTKIPEIIKRSEKMPPEAEFTGHCATLKAWAENNYNTDLLPTNIAIPLLKKLTDVGDPLAKKIFKEEIARRFNNGHLSFILYFIKSGYLWYLTKPEEREGLYYNNNKKLRELIDELLQGDYYSITRALSILISLNRLKDPSVKEVLNKQIVRFYNSGNLKALEYLSKNYTYKYLSDEEKKSIYYENNKVIRDMIDTALKDEDTSLNLGFPLLLKLTSIEDQSARELFKENVKKWLFYGEDTTVDFILRKFDYSIKVSFDHEELLHLRENPQSPSQLIDYLNEFLEKYNKAHYKIYGLTKEIILSKDMLINSYIPLNLEIPDSDFFIVFFKKISIRIPYGIEATCIPINNNNVKKIIINYAHGPDKPILDKIDYLKSKFKLLYEFGVTKVVGRNISVRIREEYFLDSNMPSNEKIEEIFTSIRDDVKIKIENLHKH